MCLGKAARRLQSRFAPSPRPQLQPGRSPRSGSASRTRSPPLPRAICPADGCTDGSPGFGALFHFSLSFSFGVSPFSISGFLYPPPPTRCTEHDSGPSRRTQSSSVHRRAPAGRIPPCPGLFPAPALRWRLPAPTAPAAGPTPIPGLPRRRSAPR